MASCWCISAVSLASVAASSSETQKRLSFVRKCFAGAVQVRVSMLPNCIRGRMRSGVVCMAPDEEKITRRSPLDFPIEWERPKPGRRPDIFPKFSPMKTPLPTPLPADPPEEDDEFFEEREEEEEDPEKQEEDEEPQGL
ncbi:hypothetical protein ZOSMA_18G00690 [Zostera marina]|uniref:Uncharacterized protein n=1 Tax=Zostera marina TaxID=29655 RepID=A0A0K9PPT3_ZOSMR|nr:hypothetical protein ZOSMA_18G00690 [Zostera marina]